MSVLVTIKVVKDGEELGEKTFEANFATVEPALRFENAIMWMIALTNPVADDLQLEAMERIVERRRAAIEEAKGAPDEAQA